MNAAFKVKYDGSIDCIRTHLEGELNRTIVGAFFSEVARVARANQCNRILSDLRNAIVGASLLDIYEEAGLLQERGIRRTDRRAVVVSRDDGAYSFWETACFNQGFDNVRIFHDYDEAENWVTKAAGGP